MPKRSIANLARQARDQFDRFVQASIARQIKKAEQERVRLLATVSALGELWESASEAHTQDICRQANSLHEAIPQALVAGGEDTDAWCETCASPDNLNVHYAELTTFFSLINKHYPKD